MVDLIEVLRELRIKIKMIKLIIAKYGNIKELQDLAKEL